MAQLYHYNGTTTQFPGDSGIFLALIGPVPLATNNNTTWGMTLTYGQSKVVSKIDNQSLILFMGRDKPAVEFGQYRFMQFDLAYSWLPGHVAEGGGTPEATFDAYLQNQQAGYLVQYQDAKYRGTSQYGLAYNALYGVISNVKITDVAEGPFLGGQSVSCTFTEVQS